MPMSSLGSTRERSVSMIFTPALMLLIADLTSAFSSSVTRSILLSSTRSAKATCCTLSLTPSSPRSSRRCLSTCLASTTVTIPSSSQYGVMASSTIKVWATGLGSAMPVVSMMIASKSSLRSRSLRTVLVRSVLTVQQTQPLSISTICSSLCCLMIASSTPTAPNSFSMTANLRPWLGSFRMWLTRVVFPAPRNPVMTVTGRRGPS
mmetsp:Transcript_16282/g.41338  ORF Transcript_16282/g.41338 Transcript_16282/m.41338 type:complete len:206 (-) Transcript_16282:62-679(-)